MQVATGLYKEILKIVKSDEGVSRERVLALLALMERLLIESTKEEQLVFSTLFARLSYVGHKRQFDKASLELLHLFRRMATRMRHGRPYQEGVVELGVKAVSSLIQLLYGEPIPEAIKVCFPEEDAFVFRIEEGAMTQSVVRVLALRDEPAHHRLVVIEEDAPAEERMV